MHFVPKGYTPVGYDSCAYRAENVEHRKLSLGKGAVSYNAGETIAIYKWSIWPRGCSNMVWTAYDPKDPHDNHKKNLKKGDIVYERHLALFSPSDMENYFSGNKRGCHPEVCSPLVIEFEGVNGINIVKSIDERGITKTLWRK